MVEYVETTHLIPLFPFLAFIVNISFGKKLQGASAVVSIIMSAVSLVLSVITFQGLQAGGGSYPLGQWLVVHNIPVNFGVTVDSLSVMMLLVVTIVGTLIQIYSVGYMHGDPRYSRYFAYLSLFMASMLGLIIADNFIMLLIFWEGVGLCSYLLISFWYERPAAAKAGLKAFITTRIGDTGLMVGIFLLFIATNTFSFSELAHIPPDSTNWMITTAVLLIFCGAIGKSAQFPLHVWLPDAMEGPTAVSALIHAATMVAAGVYLVARTFGLFAIDPMCLQVVAVIGGISALMAALIATVNNDIKRVLAYSTISQLGLMMLGLGVGGYNAGTFHLMTHAFFKALLFLCAGSVIHAVHTQDIHKMGGLISKMKVTGICFVLGTLALAGVPPFAGFWSKDEILTVAFESGHTVLFVVAALTSLLTAYYMSRLIFLVLFGKPRSHDIDHAHESPMTMTVPLMILAVFAVFIGFVGSPLTQHAFQNFISPPTHGVHAEHHPNYMIMGLSTVIALLGIGIAAVFYTGDKQALRDSIRTRFSGVYQLLLNKFYIDEIYDVIFVKPTLAVCRFLFKFDALVVDGLVNGMGHLVQLFTVILRPIQTGYVQNYILIQIIGLIIFALTLGKLCTRF